MQSDHLRMRWRSSIDIWVCFRITIIIIITCGVVYVLRVRASLWIFAKGNGEVAAVARHPTPYVQVTHIRLAIIYYLVRTQCMLHGPRSIIIFQLVRCAHALANTHYNRMNCPVSGELRCAVPELLMKHLQFIFYDVHRNGPMCRTGNRKHALRVRDNDSANQLYILLLLCISNGNCVRKGCCWR